MARARRGQHCERQGAIDDVVHLLVALNALSIVGDRLRVIPPDLAVKTQQAERDSLAPQTLRFLENAQALLEEQTGIRNVPQTHPANGQDPLCMAAPKQLTFFTEDRHRLLGVLSADPRLRHFPGQDPRPIQCFSASSAPVGLARLRQYRLEPEESFADITASQPEVGEASGQL